MRSESHRFRNTQEGVRWYECKLTNRLLYPPDKAHFPGLQSDDIFVNWIGHQWECQVWQAVTLSTLVTWVPLQWGDNREARRFVVTDGGFPSFVAESTWVKKYKRRVSVSPIVSK